MRFSVTFPGTEEQAGYLTEVIGLMGRMRDGEEVTVDQLVRFPILEAIDNVEFNFPSFEPAGFAITHDAVRGEISVYPAHRSAEVDAEAFGYVLHTMLERFERDDVVTFSYAVTGDRPYAGAYSGGAVVCSRHGWEAVATESIEQKLRSAAEARISAKALIQEAVDAGMVERPEDLRQELELDDKVHDLASGMGSDVNNRSVEDTVAWLIENGTGLDELKPGGPAPDL